MTSDSRASPAAECCTLQHRVFTLFDAPLFRRADSDGAPVMIVQLGDKEAVISLRSVQREFSIPDDTDDGRMLGLIAQSLELHLRPPHW